MKKNLRKSSFIEPREKVAVEYLLHFNHSFTVSAGLNMRLIEYVLRLFFYFFYKFQRKFSCHFYLLHQEFIASKEIFYSY